MSEVTEMPPVMLGSNGNLKPEEPARYEQWITSVTLEIYVIFFRRQRKVLITNTILFVSSCEQYKEIWCHLLLFQMIHCTRLRARLTWGRCHRCTRPWSRSSRFVTWTSRRSSPASRGTTRPRWRRMRTRGRRSEKRWWIFDLIYNFYPSFIQY